MLYQVFCILYQSWGFEPQDQVLITQGVPLLLYNFSTYT